MNKFPLLIFSRCSLSSHRTTTSRHEKNQKRFYIREIMTDILESRYLFLPASSSLYKGLAPAPWSRFDKFLLPAPALTRPGAWLPAPALAPTK